MGGLIVEATPMSVPLQTREAERRDQYLAEHPRDLSSILFEITSRI